LLLLLLGNSAVSLWRTRLGISFEKWRLTHGVFGPSILVLALGYSWFAGGNLKVFPMQLL
jgi:hypothetical protein